MFKVIVFHILLWETMTVLMIFTGILLLDLIDVIFLGILELVEMIEKLIRYFKRPKCKNRHRCRDCIYGEFIFQDFIITGMKCQINARPNRKERY